MVREDKTKAGDFRCIDKESSKERDVGKVNSKGEKVSPAGSLKSPVPRSELAENEGVLVPEGLWGCDALNELKDSTSKALSSTRVPAPPAPHRLMPVTSTRAQGPLPKKRLTWPRSRRTHQAVKSGSCFHLSVGPSETSQKPFQHLRTVLFTLLRLSFTDTTRLPSIPPMMNMIHLFLAEVLTGGIR
ncbi:THO complex subunit 2-like [Arapaima gigas]